MNSSSLILLLSVLMVSLPLSSAQPVWGYNCSNNRNYTRNSSFAANLNTLLSSIASGAPLAGSRGHFHNLTVGAKQGDDFASGTCLCRGDLSSTDCTSSCMDAAKSIRQVCPTQKQAIGWYRDCVFRYSDQPILGVMSSSPWFCSANPANASNPKLTALLQSLGPKALYGPKYAAGSRRVSGSLSVFADLGCNPDLNVSDCSRCYQDIINYIPSCCHGKAGGAILTPSCDSRVETYQFYHLSADSLSPAPTSLSSSTSKDYPERKRKSLEISAIAVATFLAVFVVVGIWIYRRQRKARHATNEEDIEDIIAVESLQFDLAAIKAATCNFSWDNKLGEGGFGEVYKGKLGNGQEVAVKRLSKNSGQGIAEFKTEVILVAGLQHKNLVKLLGFCMASKEKILVYEFLSNSSLDRFLFDTTKNKSLDWKTRFKIIRGIAGGLLYLHEDSRLRVIHRDLKSSNILLDELMNPKISDFGLAKLCGMDQTQGDTKRIVGTYGYMAPEYAMTGHFSVKSDVFSFGVIVLEIVAGQKSRHFARPQAEEALLHRAWRLWSEEKVSDLMDPGLATNYEEEEATKCIHIALLSVQEDPGRRPKMSTVIRSLNGDPISLETPKAPQFLFNSTDPGDENASSSYSFPPSISNFYPR
uniref:non-specific serine/threonine protein kinase n=2 Tax=Opuntia streptacantha TaxID=393608 RepID=A0A7C9EKU7_OPUST